MKTKRSARNNTTGEILKPDNVQQVPIIKKINSAHVRMLNRRTGRVVEIAYKTAELLSRKYPNDFKTL